ncbi:hypothetical protein B0H34DRAFT_775194 [Crassisporium funariophilum]|nr:hypothetical protein B0H34DRAFT_775194 [Crassisporium funariophilum]
MPLLTTTNRLAEAKNAGHIVLKHITLASAAQAEQSGSNPFDPKAAALSDGFYQIIQWKDDAEKPSLASVTSPTGLKSDSSVPVVMGADTDFLSNFWKLTRQYGLKNGFTVVPVATNIPATDPETGATTYDKSSVLNVYRSGSYPLWVMRCDESAEIRSPDGTSTTVVDYFRILEAGSKKCWKNSTEAADNSPINVNTMSTAARPPQSELFELIRCDIVQTSISVSSVDNIITTASDSTIVKKFYFGTGPVSNSDATSYVSVKLFTSARDQGWADQPQAGLYSWFEIAILTKNMTLGENVTDQIKKVDGKLLTWVSHSVPLTSTYTDQEGPIFAKDHDLFKNLKAGNVIAVLSCAQYANWKCDAHSGNLNFRKLVANNTNTK